MTISNIEYEILLRKYIQHIWNMEGIDYLYQRDIDSFFNKDELEELRRISALCDSL